MSAFEGKADIDAPSSQPSVEELHHPIVTPQQRYWPEPLRFLWAERGLSPNYRAGGGQHLARLLRVEIAPEQ